MPCLTPSAMGLEITTLDRADDPALVVVANRSYRGVAVGVDGRLTCGLGDVAAELETSCTFDFLRRINILGDDK